MEQLLVERLSDKNRKSITIEIVNNVFGETPLVDFAKNKISKGTHDPPMLKKPQILKAVRVGNVYTPLKSYNGENYKYMYKLDYSFRLHV